MDNCKYSIIPTPGDNLTCSSCGKKMEELPYYIQVAKCFTYIGDLDNRSRFLGFGFGVPKCYDCDTELSSSVENTEKRHHFIYVILSIVSFASFMALRFNPEAILIILFMIGVVFMIQRVNENAKEASIESQLESSGIEIVNPAIEILAKNGWLRTLEITELTQPYTDSNLKHDLD